MPGEVTNLQNRLRQLNPEAAARADELIAGGMEPTAAYAQAAQEYGVSPDVPAVSADFDTPIQPPTDELDITMPTFGEEVDDSLAVEPDLPSPDLVTTPVGGPPAGPAQPAGNGRSAIMQALSAMGQRPAVEAPVVQPPDSRLRILQALSKAGSGLLGLRDQSRTEKRNRASQATANVINALSKGRAGARGLEEEARPGLLTRLAAVPGQVAGAGLEIQTDRQAAEQQAFENRIKGAGRPFDEMNTILQRQQEEERIRIARLNAAMRDRTTTVAEKGSTLKVEKFEYEKWRDKIDLKGEEPTSSLQTGLQELGRKGMSLNTVLDGDVEMRERYNSYGPTGKLVFEQALAKGTRLHAQELDKALLTLRRGMGPAGSASERMQIADAESFQGELKDLQGLWNAAGMRGFVQGLFQTVNIGFDPDEHTGSLFMRRVFDDSANLSDALAGFGLKIARILNGGRPSDKDLIAARRLLPLQSDSDDLAEKKFQFLQTVFQKRVNAIRNQLTTNFGPAADESVEDYIKRAMNNPGEVVSAAVVNAETGAVPSVNTEDMDF
jgi:hypothetical protein